MATPKSHLRSGVETTASPDPQLAEEGLAYHRALLAGAAAASASHGRVDLDLRIAGTDIRISFSSPRLAEMLSPALEHRRADFTVPRFILDVFDRAMDPGSAPDSPWGWIPLDDAEQTIARYEDERLSILMESRDRTVTAFDRVDGRAAILIPDTEALPAAERDTRLRYPLQMILGAAGQPMVHSALVGEGDLGLLLPGASGSGKSTLAISAAQRGMDFCSDDYIVLEPDGLRGHALLTTTKLTRESAARLGLAHDTTGAERIFGDRGAGEFKATIDVRDFAADRFRSEMAIAATVVPRLGGAGSGAVRPVPGTVALLALAPTTLKQQPSRNSSLFGAMAAIVRDTPSFELDLAPDPAANVDALRQALAEVRTGRQA